jgi:hypothetical protein
MPQTAAEHWQLHQSLYKSHICYKVAAMQPCTQLRVAGYTEQAAFLASQLSWCLSCNAKISPSLLLFTCRAEARCCPSKGCQEGQRVRCGQGLHCHQAERQELRHWPHRPGQVRLWLALPVKQLYTKNKHTLAVALQEHVHRYTSPTSIRRMWCSSISSGIQVVPRKVFREASIPRSSMLTCHCAITLTVPSHLQD